MDQTLPVSCLLALQFNISMFSSQKRGENKFKMSNIPYASTIAGLMYGMVCMRSEITFVVSATSRFLVNLGKDSWKATKWVVWYLRGTFKTCP